MNFFSANRTFFCTLGVIVFVLLFYAFFLNAPADFPIGTIVKIESGSSLRSVSLKLKQARIIRSRLAFEALSIFLNGEKRVISSNYYFEDKLSVFEVARRISRGEHHLAPIIVTIPEGFDTRQIADVFASKLANFNKSKFLSETKTLEGNLFPDTYFFLTTDTEMDVIKSMRANFEKKIIPLRPDIISSGKTEEEIIKIASIIEKEAKSNADRASISGILWNRLKINMLLQVDVAPETYRKKGLPQNPICNPGIESIKAAIYPENSPYLFFIYDKNDHIHYAKNFTEHQKNVLKYLR